MRSVLLGIFLYGIVLAACSAQKEIPASTRLEESFSLALQDSITFSDGETSFQLSVATIQDNRCPADVNCITGGKATVLVQVERQAEPFQFCIGADCQVAAEEHNSFTLEENNKRYTIVLEDVSPYPQQGNEMMAKQAIFKIKQATQ